MPTKIQRTDEIWNPAHGCTKISAGCKNCNAERTSKRLAGRCGYPEAPDNFEVTLRPDRLEQPLKWREPRRVFVCSMGDLFHDDVPEDFIWRVIEIAWAEKQHTFQILTKRPARMLDVLTRSAWWNNDTPGNIWLGVTVENQQAADERIPLLLQTPAAVRFVSAEPLLSSVNLHLHGTVPGFIHGTGRQLAVHSFIDLVTTGGETGPGARPMHPDWARGLRDQCRAAEISFFHKHNGEWIDYLQAGAIRCQTVSDDRGLVFGGSLDGQDFPLEYIGQSPMLRVGKKEAGHLLDGRAWRQMPKVTK